MARWREFELLAERILAELQPDAAVKWNDLIDGHITEAKRQVDVSIRWTSGDDEYLTIVQAKDHGRPADIKVVDEFLSVIRDVKASSGILICRSGFTKAAHTYARNSGVSLLNLHDAQSINWSLELTIPIVWIELTPRVRVEWSAYFEAGDSFPDKDPLGPPMTTDGGKTRINPMSTFERYWGGPDAIRTLGQIHHLLSDQPVQAIVQDSNGQVQLRPVQALTIAYTIDRKVWLGQFRPAECRGLVDYLDGQAFTASYLPLAEIPAQRSDEWEEVDAVDRLAITTRGTVVTTAQIKLVSDGKVEQLDIRYLGPNPNRD
ncbi:restriction endonuclease [Longispora urticae]